MAQRRRRRGRFNRIRPDMGWWIDTGAMYFTYQPPGEGGQTFGTAESIIQFNDVTDDDSLITRDNSDWFIKRVIVEAWPTLATASLQNSADRTRRRYTLMVGTIDNDKLAEWVVNQPHHLFEPNGYEMWSRMLRTYNRTVYGGYTPKVVVGSANTGATATVTGSAENFIYNDVAPWWGFSHIEDDFTVSNAGLKPEQSLSIAVGAMPNALGLYQWRPDEDMSVDWALRVLLQKRRAA